MLDHCKDMGTIISLGHFKKIHCFPYTAHMYVDSFPHGLFPTIVWQLHTGTTFSKNIDQKIHLASLLSR